MRSEQSDSNRHTSVPTIARLLIIVCSIVFAVSIAFGQSTAVAAERGSQTAKAGFKNEDEIRDKFNNWRLDPDVRAWLAAMNYNIADIDNIVAVKPHGKKTDVELRIRTTRGAEAHEGISIKLVSSSNGFNQIDKRWLRQYAEMWKMPAEVVAALKLFLGETPPTRTGRDVKRTYLNELDAAAQKAVVDFFLANKDEIVSDLIAGDGQQAARWFMVAHRSTAGTRCAIRSSADAAKFFGDGKVEITRAGNLKIGRITMQRKGGDGGRETAKMLQFKINPVQILNAK